MFSLHRPPAHSLRFVLCFALCQTLYVSPFTMRTSAVMPPAPSELSASSGKALPTATVPVKDEQERARISASYGKLPLAFEANKGQTDERVKFTARGAGYSLFLTTDETVLSLRKNTSDSGSKEKLRDGDMPEKRAAELNERRNEDSSSHLSAVPSNTAAFVRMKLLGANNRAQVTGEDEQAGKSNYFIGSDPSRWRTDVARYAKVRYKEVYPGIDQIFYGNQGHLEFDFVVAPHSDPRQINFAYEGVKAIGIARNGDLLIKTADGAELRLNKPSVYQKRNGRREVVTARYVIEGKRVRFNIGRHDADFPLVIDPILSYSTLIGLNTSGSNSYTTPYGIAVDSSGNAYITGYTNLTAFPTTAGAYQQNLPGIYAAFVTKLNATGTGLVYSTYLGTSQGYTYGYAIAVDAAGSAYVTGDSDSGFPTTAGAYRTSGGGSFVTKLNSGGNSLIYSTFLNNSSGVGIAVDSSGNAYISGNGYTNATSGSFSQSNNGGDDTFVTKLNATGTNVIYSTYIGGNGADYPSDLAVDSSGNAYVTGQTTSSNFPTKNAFQSSVPHDRGVYASSNGGNNWQLSNNNLSNGGITSIAVDPRTPSTVYADGYDGIFKSNDGGGTWNRLNNRGYYIAIAPSTPSTLYVCGYYAGVSKSTDGGSTWNYLSNGLTYTYQNATYTTYVSSVSIDPNNASIVYAVTGEGVYKTTDGGNNWTPINSGLPVNSYNNLTISISQVLIDSSNSTTLYASAGYQGGVYKSTNGGSSWTAVNTGLVDQFNRLQSINQLAISASSPMTLYAATYNGVYRTTNGAGSWSKAANNGLTASCGQNCTTTPYANALVVDPINSATIYYATNYGAFKSVNGGDNWSANNNGLIVTNLQTLAINPQNPSVIYTGTYGRNDGFVTKLSADGSALAYSTYLSGYQGQFPYTYLQAIAVDATGNAYTTGYTNTPDFPTTSGSYQTSNPNGSQTAFVTKLNSVGNNLVYSTFLPAKNGYSDGYGIAVDSAGNAYIAGRASSGYPTTSGSFQTRTSPNSSATFVTKLNAAGSGLIYSSFLGGSNYDSLAYRHSIALDSSNNVYVVGNANSFNFPTTRGAYQSPPQNTNNYINAIFVSKISESANSFSIVGTVKDANGNSVSNAFVTLKDSSGNVIASYQTDSNGYYQFVSLLPGTYTVVASGTGYRFTPSNSVTFTNVSTDQTANFTAALVISGRITDNSGNGISKILAALSGSQGQSTRTDAQGNYTFTNFSSNGSYTVTPTDPNLIFTPASSSFTGGQTGVNFTATVSPNPVPTPTPSEDFSGNQRDPTKFQLGSITQPAGSVDPNVSVVQQNGQLVITPVANASGAHFNGYVSTNSFDFTNGTASLEVVRAASGGAMSVFAIGSDTNNFYRFVNGNASSLTTFGIERETLVKALGEARIELSTLDFDNPLADAPTFLVFQVVQNGVSKTVAIPYDPIAHRFWQFRNDQTVTNDYPNGAIVFETSPDKVTYKEQFRAGISKPINAMQTEISAGTTSSVPAPSSAAYDNYVLTLNDIDSASFYVGQHYRDFLNRQADIGGLQFWTNEIFSCGADAKCIDIKRQNVSAAYFLSLEFQQTGFLVYQLYKASFGNIAGKPVPVTFQQFLPDVQAIGTGVIVGQNGYEAKLEANKVSFINAFVNRAAFKTVYPDSLTPAQFVDQLNANAGNFLSQTDRNNLVAGLQNGTQTRATVLRTIADPERNAAFKQTEFNRAFVLMQYFGYLRRNPDDAPEACRCFDGYNFWLNKLNSFGGDYIRSEMVRSFTVSTEYRKRFGKS